MFLFSTNCRKAVAAGWLVLKLLVASQSYGASSRTENLLLPSPSLCAAEVLGDDSFHIRLLPSLADAQALVDFGMGEPYLKLVGILSALHSRATLERLAQRLNDAEGAIEVGFSKEMLWDLIPEKERPVDKELALSAFPTLRQQVMPGFRLRRNSVILEPPFLKQFAARLSDREKEVVRGLRAYMSEQDFFSAQLLKTEAGRVELNLVTFMQSVEETIKNRASSDRFLSPDAMVRRYLEFSLLEESDPQYPVALRVLRRTQDAFFEYAKPWNADRFVEAVAEKLAPRAQQLLQNLRLQIENEPIDFSAMADTFDHARLKRMIRYQKRILDALRSREGQARKRAEMAKKQEARRNGNGRRRQEIVSVPATISLAPDSVPAAPDETGSADSAGAAARIRAKFGEHIFHLDAYALAEFLDTLPRLERSAFESQLELILSTTNLNDARAVTEPGSLVDRRDFPLSSNVKLSLIEVRPWGTATGPSIGRIYFNYVSDGTPFIGGWYAEKDGKNDPGTSRVVIEASRMWRKGE